MPEPIHVTEEELILHYYGEPGGDRRVADHLAACAACRAALAELGETLALVDAQPTVEPLAGLEERVWARVQADAAGRGSHRVWRIFDAAPRWALAGGVAALLAAAFLAGRFSTPPPEPAPPQAATAADDPARRVLVLAIGDHLDRSQMVLLELLNADAASLADEQTRARDLVAANRLYRQTLARAGDERVEEVLDALERVLLEIANAPSNVTPRDLDVLRAEIEQRGILFRVRVIASEMRAREQQDAMTPPQTGP